MAVLVKIKTLVVIYLVGACCIATSYGEKASSCHYWDWVRKEEKMLGKEVQKKKRQRKAGRKIYEGDGRVEADF